MERKQKWRKDHYTRVEIVDRNNDIPRHDSETLSIDLKGQWIQLTVCALCSQRPERSAQT